MNRYFWILWATVLIVLSGMQFTSAAQTTTTSTTKTYQTTSYNSYPTRQQIRRMPMVARPSRPGHFIGNTVRRAYHRRHARGYYRGR